MFEPKLTDPQTESAKTYPQKIFCTKHNREAEIVMANWPFSEEGWSDWRVIDCSLLPPGAVRCGMECFRKRAQKTNSAGVLLAPVLGKRGLGLR